MELNESIDSLNSQLVDLFGIHTETGDPMFQIVFSDVQFEMRKGEYNDFTPSGIFIRTVTEVRNAPKYQWIKGRWVLEQLCVVPEINLPELPASKLSYEPLWIFETQSGEYLPPRIDALKLIINTMHAALGHSSLKKYVDSEANTTKEGRAAMINELQAEMFGNETLVGDALAYKTGVIVPHPMKES